MEYQNRKVVLRKSQSGLSHKPIPPSCDPKNHLNIAQLLEVGIMFFRFGDAQD